MRFLCVCRFLCFFFVCFLFVLFVFCLFLFVVCCWFLFRFLFVAGCLSLSLQKKTTQTKNECSFLFVCVVFLILKLYKNNTTKKRLLFLVCLCCCCLFLKASQKQHKQMLDVLCLFVLLFAVLFSLRFAKTTQTTLDLSRLFIVCVCVVFKFYKNSEHNEKTCFVSCLFVLFVCFTSFTKQQQRLPFLVCLCCFCMFCESFTKTKQNA